MLFMKVDALFNKPEADFSFGFFLFFGPPYICISFHRSLQVCEIKTTCPSNDLQK